MVACGGSRRHWRDFDALTAPIRAAGIPLLPILGNHDLWGGRRRALREISRRFPETGRGSWSRQRRGPLELVFLDTGRAQEQVAWLAAALDAAATDPACRAVVAFGHHPPFTNSAASGDHAATRRVLVPLLLRCPRFLCMLSGHVHAFERFQVAGREFLVAGGGGGPRVALRRGARQRHSDLCTLPVPRPLHWLELSAGDDGVTAAVRGLLGQAAPVTTVEQFRLPWPAVAEDQRRIACRPRTPEGGAGTSSTPGPSDSEAEAPS
jgi:3',5'-cyclic AMP phosphodiesterase CpdA